MHAVRELRRREQQPVLRGFRSSQVGAGEAHVVGERLRPDSGIGLERKHPLHPAFAGGVHAHELRVGVGIGGIGRGAQAIVALAHDPGARIVLHSVLDSVEIPGEPAVHEGERRLASVALLVVVRLHRHAPVGQRGHDPVAVLGHHVPVVESVRHERGSAHAIDVVEVVAARPEVVVVPGGAVEARLHEVAAHGLVAVVAALHRAAVDEVVEDVDVLAGIAARRPHQPMRPVVVVVRRVGGHRDDGLEPLHPRGGGGERQGAVVGGSDHAHAAGGPVGAHLLPALDLGEAARAPVEPVDHRLRGQRLVLAAYGGAALRLSRPGGLRVHHREPARHPGGDVRVRDDRLLLDVVHRGHHGARRRRRAHLLADVPEVAEVEPSGAGIVRAGLVDHGDLEPGLGRGGTGHVDMHPVGSAVAVGVEVGLDPEFVPHPGGRIRELRDDLRLPVLEDGPGPVVAGRGGEQRQGSCECACPRDAEGTRAGEGRDVLHGLGSPGREGPAGRWPEEWSQPESNRRPPACKSS